MRTIRWRNGQCPGRNGQWAERIAHAGSEAVRLVPFSSLLLSETLTLSSGRAAAKKKQQVVQSGARSPSEAARGRRAGQDHNVHCGAGFGSTRRSSSRQQLGRVSLGDKPH